MRTQKYLIAALSLSLASCAPKTVDELRNNPGIVYNYSVQKNYEKVFSTLVEMTNKCLTWDHGAHAEFYIVSSKDKGKKTAVVTWRYISPLNDDTWGNFDIRATGENAASVETNFILPYSSRGKWGKRSEIWLTGITDCEPKI